MAQLSLISLKQAPVDEAVRLRTAARNEPARAGEASGTRQTREGRSNDVIIVKKGCGLTFSGKDSIVEKYYQ
jgi:hypothetical protein